MYLIVKHANDRKGRILNFNHLLPYESRSQHLQPPSVLNDNDDSNQVIDPRPVDEVSVNSLMANKTRNMPKMTAGLSPKTTLKRYS